MLDLDCPHVNAFFMYAGGGCSPIQRSEVTLDSVSCLFLNMSMGTLVLCGLQDGQMAKAGADALPKILDQYERGDPRRCTRAS
jgi:hypothetical protein